MNELIEQIENLNREEALEAGQLLALKITEDRAAGEREQQLLKPLLDQPYANIEEIEQLSRLVLLTAAIIEEYEADVKNAIEGTGRKQFILGGTEIVALAVVSLFALQAILSKGKSNEEEVITIEEKDGQTSVSIKKKTKFGISGSLGKILKNYFT